MENREKWCYLQKRMYLHTKQVYYLVACPRCESRGRKLTCKICGGTGKVSPEIWERLSEREERNR